MTNETALYGNETQPDGSKSDYGLELVNPGNGKSYVKVTSGKDTATVPLHMVCKFVGMVETGND